MEEEDLTDQSYVTLVVTVAVLMLAVVVILAYLVAIIQPAWMKNLIEYFKSITNQKKKSDKTVTTTNAAGKKDYGINNIRGVKPKPKKEKNFPHRRPSQSSVQELPIPDGNSTDEDESSVRSSEESSKKSLRNRKPTSKKQHVEEVAVETLAGHNIEEEPFVWIPDEVPATNTNKKRRSFRKKKRELIHPETLNKQEIDQSQAHRLSVSSDSSKSNQDATRRKIPFREEKNCYHFSLDEAGGIIEFPFGKADFPKNAVSERTQLRFVPLNTKSYGDENITLLTPAIHCSQYIGYDCVDFKFPIKFEMKTLKKGNKDMEVQVTQSSTDLMWETVEKSKILKEQNSICFQLNQFAGFRVIARNLEIRPVLSIYHTLYVKRPTGIPDPSQHNFTVIIHSDHREARKNRESIIRSRTAHVISEPQTLLIRPPCSLTVHLSCEQMISVPSEREYHIDEQRKYFLKNFHIQLKKQDREVPIDLDQNMNLIYSVSSELESSNEIPFQWTIPLAESTRSRRESVASSIFSVHGTSPIGVQNVYYDSNHNNNRRDHPDNVKREQSSPAGYSCERSAEEISSQRQLDHQSLSEPALHTEERSSTPVHDGVTPESFNFTSLEDVDVQFSLGQE